MDSDGGASGQRVLGCSRCRYSLKGCSRCKKPTFTHRGPRQHAAGSASGSRAANGSSKGAATSPDDADAAPRPAQRERRRRPHHTPHHLQQHHHYQQYSQQLDDPYQQPLPGAEEEVEDPKALMQGVAFELTQLEQLQQDISTMQHRKRARTQLAADRPEGHGDLAKRLRTSLLGPAGAAGWAPGPAQEEAEAAAAAAAGGGAHQQQHHSSSFAQTLEARIKAFAESGRRSVPTSPGSAKAGGDGFHAAATAAAPAAAAAAAAAQAAKIKAEADLADMAAELGALAAAVSDDGGDTSVGAADAAGGAAHKQQQQHQQQRSDDSAGGFGTLSSSVDTAEAEVAAAAAAGSPVSPGGSSKSPGARSRPVSAVKAKGYAHLLLPGMSPREPVPGWQAPASPFGLLEEELWQNPWQLLLGCMLLNKTSGTQVRRVFWKLLELCPTPEAAVAADTGAIRDIIAPLGLHNKRAVAVQRLSQDYLEKEWTCPTELYGIGKYAADAYYMFCRGQWEGVQPDDKDLIKYHEWMRATGGQGMALEPPAAAAAAAAGQAQAVADEQAGVQADVAGTGSTAVVVAGGGAAGSDAGAEANGEGAPEVQAEGHVAAGSSPDAPAPDAAGVAGGSAAAGVAGAAGDSAAAAEAAGEQAAGDAGAIEQTELLV